MQWQFPRFFCVSLYHFHSSQATWHQIKIRATGMEMKCKKKLLTKHRTVCDWRLAHNINTHTNGCTFRNWYEFKRNVSSATMGSRREYKENKHICLSGTASEYSVYNAFMLSASGHMSSFTIWKVRSHENVEHFSFRCVRHFVPYALHFDGFLQRQKPRQKQMTFYFRNNVIGNACISKKQGNIKTKRTHTHTQIIQT